MVIKDRLRSPRRTRIIQKVVEQKRRIIGLLEEVQVLRATLKLMTGDLRVRNRQMMTNVNNEKSEMGELRFPVPLVDGWTPARFNGGSGREVVDARIVNDRMFLIVRVHRHRN